MGLVLLSKELYSWHLQC